MAEIDFKYDVFISYSHEDEEWVRNVLLPTLEKQELKVCIDYRDFIAGKPAIINMADAAEASRHTLLVLTPRWVESEWTLYESILSRTDDPSGLQRRTIPLLLEKCSPPKFITILSWVDFADKKREKEAWQNLFKSLDKEVEAVEQAIHSPYKTGWFFGHRYGDLESFTGRADELNMLNDWLNNDKDNLLMIRALGGFGKSALTWTWFNSVDREKWQTAIWWSFYEKESGFESFLAETLKHLGVEVKASARQQVNDLLEAMRGTNILIVLDGFERLLRQYGRMDAALQPDDEDADIDPSQRDCSSPLTETFLRGLSGAGMRSKVLMTTRLCPRVLESADGKLLKGCRDEALSVFSPDDAVTYFHKEGIAATRAEILAVCSAYGYHPLSLSLLVGLINEDHEQRGDIEAVKNLEIFEDVKARRHHVLERAYESLAPERRDLLSKISCFRGSMEYAVLKKVFPSPDLDKALLDLRKRGLLQYAGESQRYDMHPIVRHYAYDRLTTPNRTAAHTRLRDYFATVDVPEKIQFFEDIVPVIELYHHTVQMGLYDQAFVIFQERLHRTLFYQFSANQTIIELIQSLFLDSENKHLRLQDRGGQAVAMTVLANSYKYIGQPRLSVPIYQMVNEIYENELMSAEYLAIGLGNLAMAHIHIGELAKAERSLRHKIDLYRSFSFLGNDERKEWRRFIKATGHVELGQVLIYRGSWQEADYEFSIGLNEFEGLSQAQGKGAIWSYRSEQYLLMARLNQIETEHLHLAVCRRASW